MESGGSGFSGGGERDAASGGGKADRSSLERGGPGESFSDRGQYDAAGNWSPFDPNETYGYNPPGTPPGGSWLNRLGGWLVQGASAFAPPGFGMINGPVQAGLTAIQGGTPAQIDQSFGEGVMNGVFGGAIGFGRTAQNLAEKAGATGKSSDFGGGFGQAPSEKAGGFGFEGPGSTPGTSSPALAQTPFGALGQSPQIPGMPATSYATSMALLAAPQVFGENSKVWQDMQRGIAMVAKNYPEMLPWAQNVSQMVSQLIASVSSKQGKA